jgi:hypothetical protein
MGEHMFVALEAPKPADLAFFSGFVAGDGSFLVRENNAGLSTAAPGTRCRRSRPNSVRFTTASDRCRAWST